MQRKIQFFVVGLLAMLLAAGVMAQDATEAELCSASETVNAQFGDGKEITTHEAISELFDSMTQAAQIEDMKTYLDMARLVRGMLERIEADCVGLHFTSEVEGEQPVIGPVTFPDGVWKAVFTTANYGIVGLEPLSGKCEGGRFNASTGQATEGAEAVFKPSEGCTVLISVSNTRDGWDLRFEPITLTGE